MHPFHIDNLGNINNVHDLCLSANHPILDWKDDLPSRIANQICTKNFRTVSVFSWTDRPRDFWFSSVGLYIVIKQRCETLFKSIPTMEEVKDMQIDIVLGNGAMTNVKRPEDSFESIDTELWTKYWGIWKDADEVCRKRIANNTKTLSGVIR